MNIGFDAKRAFHNTTGLGHYSRNLIHSLSSFYPEHHYFLFNPKSSSTFTIQGNNIHELQPTGFFNSFFPSYWRSSGVKSDLRKQKIDIYHGLSHEIPLNIHKTGIKSVVTIHDLIHERFPDQYRSIDVRIYNKKFRYACEYSNKIIAISRQTKKDIIDFYGTDSGKIEVCYQSCNPAFSLTVDDAEKETVKRMLKLPDQFFLYVGSIIERKNLLTICKALHLMGNEISIPLVVIGDGGSYKQKVKEFIASHALESQVIFLSEEESISKEPAFRTAKIFPAIYQQALAMIYPSSFEGFGIPVLEALCSRLPVITSNLASLPEAGGDAALYVDPLNAEQLADAMKSIYLNPQMADDMRLRGWNHAQNFTPRATAERVMRVYGEL